jgi:GT2 family glycosyltransferase
MSDSPTGPVRATTADGGRPSVSAVIVTYKDVELTLAAIASLKAQTAGIDELIVVDNDPAQSARTPIAAAHADVRLLAADNVGYAPACNLGAAVATGDWLFFLNPDAEADPDCLERLLAVADEHPEAAIVTPQVLFPDGETINAGENEIHLTGVAWCGRFGQAAEDAPARTAFITTGAAMLVRADVYHQLGGYCDEFFLYYEDPDICWRTWVVGREVWYVPRARVRHHYSWGSGTTKWFYLERHRLLAVLSNYRLSTLLVLAPLLAGTELAVLALASHEGWRSEKLRAYRSVWERRRWIVARHRRLEAMRRLPDAQLIGAFRATVDTPQISSRIAQRAAPFLRLYARGARSLVRAIGR